MRTLKFSLLSLLLCVTLIVPASAAPGRVPEVLSGPPTEFATNGAGRGAAHFTLPLVATHGEGSPAAIAGPDILHPFVTPIAFPPVPEPLQAADQPTIRLPDHQTSRNNDTAGLPSMEVLYLDMHIGQAGPVVGTSILEPNVAYVVRVSGTWSAWYHHIWSSYCGQPEDWPMIPSPGVQNGRVGVDAAYVFAAPVGKVWCERPDDPPWRLRNLEISLDGGATWVKADPIDTGYHVDHLYEYLIVGQGLPGRFRLLDSTGDNYGVLTIQVGGEEPSGARIVAEARLDIGMPYPIDGHRGCPSDYYGCGKPYHGFGEGVCSDVAIDAYLYGVPFDLIAAAMAEARTNRHGYWWHGDPRSAHDMYTYFTHTVQLLEHDDPYEPGDIAFFQWTNENWHVAVVSEVDATGRPTAMVDAPGCNLSCTALEHGWTDAPYTVQSQGHGRLGAGGAALRSASGPLQTLVLSVDAPANMRLYDPQGRFVSDEFDGGLIASNIDAHIPYIPGGWYDTVGSTTLITVTQPLSNTADYFVQLTGASDGDYHLRVETLQDGNLTASETFTQAITVGETQAIALTLDAPSGVLTFDASLPRVVPLMTVTPDKVELVGLTGATAAITVTVVETGGRQPLGDVSVSVSNVSNQMGQEVAATLFTVTPSRFEVPAGSSQSVELEIDLAGIQPRLYQGGLVVTPANGHSQSVPLSLIIEPFRTFLPLIVKTW